MRNFALTTLSIFIFLFCISISFALQPDVVLASNAQGTQDLDIAEIKKQLDVMEETIKRQQEMINVLKDKIETKGKVVANPTPSYREESEIERVIDNYLTKDETREKMVKAGLAPKIDVGYKKGFYFIPETVEVK
ncbi:hypothetical protein LCGC14_1586180 [marine sediment metagenome]|uniref:Uncharacterized protein n=1 Tax=marine sediment metagenome TaxID=412755 RepID=A0A0F9LFQ2_9ZZZZ